MFSILRNSLRSLVRMSALRQAVFQTAIFVFLLAGAGLAALNTIDREFERRIESELLARFDTIAAEIDALGFEQDAYPFTQFERILFVPGRRMVDPGFDTDLEDEDDKKFEREFDRDFGRGQWVYYAGDIEGGQLIVGTNLGRRDDFIEVLAGALTFIGTSAAGIALALGLFLGFRTQRRFNKITLALRDVAGGDLSARTQITKSRDDLDDLAHQVDETIAQLDVLMRQTRDFSANIAHDLKTPLARLRIRLETALSAELDSGESADQIGAALEQADRVIAIFDAFLRIAKLQSGSAKAKFERLDLGDVAYEVAELYQPFVEDTGHVFSFDVRRGQVVNGDRVLLIQMLANLIENAVRHTPQGSDIRLVVKGSEIGIADNGPGIPPEEYEKVTRPLYRLDKSRTTQGAGLGLSLVKTIANLHGAELVMSTADEVGNGLYVRADFSNQDALTEL